MADVRNIDAFYWSRLKQGEPAALGYLYDQYIDPLFEAALRFTADREMARDTLQELFVELWQYRETIAIVDHSLAYLLKALRHKLIKKMKQEQLTGRLLLADYLVSPEENSEERHVARDGDAEQQHRLGRAMAALTGRQRQILKMHYYEGLSYAEIAERLQMNYQSVNNLAYRTLRRLRSHLSLLVCCYLSGF